MKALEFTNDKIVEAAMNPSEYNKAIDAGHDQGVLVGFEFEVCIPEASLAFQLPATERNSEQDKNALAKRLKEISFLASSTGIQYAGEYTVPYDIFDSIFKLKPGIKAPFKTVQAATMDLVKNNKYYIAICNAYQVITELMDEKTLQDILSSSTHENLNKPNFNVQLDALGYLSDHIMNYVTDNDVEGDYFLTVPAPNVKLVRNAGETLYKAGIKLSKYLTWDRVLNHMLGSNYNGTKNDYTLFIRCFDFDPDNAAKKLSTYIDIHPSMFGAGALEGEPTSSYGYRLPYAYGKGARMLKPILATIYGKKVTIYSEYHQLAKNLTDWYIEPDGSLEPNRRDSAAEIVSPPMPAKEAIEALKKFYEIAKILKLYTSQKNGTGLHINVSIPKHVDVLKLAVFLGDQYVLQAFGREDNEYAQSVLDSLKKSINYDPYPYVKITKNSVDMKYAKLEALAKQITQDHTASISNNGKYISFRHAGGDYLNQPTEVLNVVGRFVRAMIIANDPNLYKEEYTKKLMKLFSEGFFEKQKKQKPGVTTLVDNLYSLAKNVKQYGLPVLNTDIFYSLYQDEFTEKITEKEIKANPGYIPPKLNDFATHAPAIYDDIYGLSNHYPHLTLTEYSTPLADNVHIYNSRFGFTHATTHTTGISYNIAIDTIKTNVLIEILNAAYKSGPDFPRMLEEYDNTNTIFVGDYEGRTAAGRPFKQSIWYDVAYLPWSTYDKTPEKIQRCLKRIIIEIRELKNKK